MVFFGKAPLGAYEYEGRRVKY